MDKFLLSAKFVIGSLLAFLSLAAWVIAAYYSSTMGVMNANSQMSGMNMSLSPLQVLLFLFIWVVMMVAMMLPSTAPMIMSYIGLSQQRNSVYSRTLNFALGYFIIWAGFGMLAYMASMFFSSLVMDFPMLQSYDKLFAAVVLISAGAYQFSPLKYACLSHCRTPMGFILHHWREGKLGALRMGISHGIYCVGCCWVLMVLLFTIGLMNLALMASLALFIFIEKVSSHGLIVGKTVGFMLIAAGILMFGLFTM